MKYNGKCLLSIDWLSIYVRTLSKRVPTRGEIKCEDYGTQVYKFTERYLRNGNEIAVLTYQPRSKALQSDSGIIKFHNSVLYQENLYELVMEVLEDWGLLALSVSRLDICADFHCFNGYEDMQDFFSDFLNVGIWKIGKQKYKAIGEINHNHDKEVFSVQGVQATRHNYQYLRFGGNTSPCAAYLYNKSQEFRDVKQKNYIIDMWEKNQMDTNIDTWRLEFSLKGNGIKFVEQETGEFIDNKLDFVKDKTMLRRLFVTLMHKFWDFRINDGQIRKDRMRKLCMLTLHDTPLKACKFTLCNDTRLGDKRLISSMERVYSELRNKNLEEKSLLRYTINYIRDAKGLTTWHQHKFGTT